MRGAIINQEKLVGLQLGICRGESMSFNNVKGFWTEKLVKLLGVWFGVDRQVENNCDQVTSRVSNITPKWAERKLSLK